MYANLQNWIHWSSAGGLALRVSKVLTGWAAQSFPHNRGFLSSGGGRALANVKILGQGLDGLSLVCVNVTSSQELSRQFGNSEVRLGTHSLERIGRDAASYLRPRPQRTLAQEHESRFANGQFRGRVNGSSRRLLGPIFSAESNATSSRFEHEHVDIVVPARESRLSPRAFGSLPLGPLRGRRYSGRYSERCANNLVRNILRMIVDNTRLRMWGAVWDSRYSKSVFPFGRNSFF